MANRERISISTDLSDGLCFGCGENNPIGLKLNFRWDGRVASTRFTPTELYQGWPKIVHGGIIATMLDEAMSYAVRFSGVDFLTARMETSFKRPIMINEPLVISGSIVKNKGRFLEARAEITLRDGTLMAEGNGTFVVVNASDKKERPESNAQA